jgi:hypothetical protein
MAASRSFVAIVLSKVQAGPRRNSARDHAPFSKRALSCVFVKTAAARIFITPDGYRLESHERGGSATLILPAGKRNVVMGCIRFGIFSRCHTVDMGCTTPAYQLDRLPYPKQARRRCSGDDDVAFGRSASAP